MQLSASMDRSRMLFACAMISGNFSSERPHRSTSRIVDHRLDAKYALAFGINLQTQLAAVQLEDRQIIRRSLDRDFPFSRFPFPLAIFRTNGKSRSRDLRMI